MHIPEMNEWRCSGRLTDIVIEIDGRRFNCHRVALASASEYFDTMLGSSFPESRSGTVYMRGISADIFEVALQYIYTGEVEITTGNVYHLLRVADYLILKSQLERDCAVFIEKNLPIPYMLDAASFAWTTGRNSLLYHITNYISLHLRGFSETSEFLELPVEVVKMIIDLSPLRIDIVMKATIHWIIHNRQDRWHYFYQLSRLGMMAGVSTADLKSIAPSIMPDEIYGKDSLSYLEDLRKPTIDKALFIYWRLSGARLFGKILKVSVHRDSLKCNVLRTSSRFVGLKKVVFNTSQIVFSLTFVFDDQTSIRDYGIFDFRSHAPYASELRSNILTPPLIKRMPSYLFSHIQMCGLEGSKRIYMYMSNENCMFVYHYEENKWYPLNVAKPLVWATMATCETNNLVYLMGSTRHNIAYLLAYDGCVGKWKELPSPKCAYIVGAPICAFNGKLYAYNETHFKYEIFDSCTMSWHFSRPNPYMNAALAERIVPYGDELWLFGTGRLKKDDDDDEQKNAYIVYIYKPESDSWHKYPLIRATIEEHGRIISRGSCFLDAIVL